MEDFLRDTSAFRELLVKLEFYRNFGVTFKRCPAPFSQSELPKIINRHISG
jgi:hypothetical protein